MLRHTAVLIVAVGLLVAGILMSIFILVPYVFSDFGPKDCTYARLKELAAQDGFVRTHVRDANNFEVATYDCGSGQTTQLKFVTTSTPAAARTAFLSDATCKLLDTSDPDADATVSCGSGSDAMALYFERTRSGTTGYLYFP